MTTRAADRVCGSCSDLPKKDPAFQAARRGTKPQTWNEAVAAELEDTRQAERLRPWDMLAAELGDTKQHERIRKGRDPVHR